MKTKANKTESSAKKSSSFFSKGSNNSFFAAQTKLSVGQPGDKYEQEADKVAEQVVNHDSDTPSFFTASAAGIQTKNIATRITPLIQKSEEEEAQSQIEVQRQEEEEEAQAKMELQKQEEEEEAQPKLQRQPLEEEEEMLQTQPEEEEEELLMPKTENGALNVNKMTAQKLQGTRGNGNPLNPAIRRQMENSFGADFKHVKIHTDSTAVQMNKNLGAQAFASNNDIYFNEGKYKPDTNAGKKLLAHELTHTIQQAGKADLNVQFTIGDNRDLVSFRFANNTVLEACLDGEQTLRYGRNGRPVSLMQQALVDAGFPLPVYGVDGIFEAETQGALQNFQRASSIPVTGVLDVATMSSLDALYSYGAPILPTGSPSNVAPTIASSTINFAPDGTADTRAQVGVGEYVRFLGNTAGTWTASAGRIVGINSGENMVWEAPAVASASTITLTAPGGAASLNMTIVAPDSLAMAVGSNPPIPSGTLGASMLTNLIVHPLNVNFGRTQWFEVPGPATNVSGYWSSYSAAQLFHRPNRNYLPFDDLNSGLVDLAQWLGGSRPFSNGTHDWVIPNRYKIDGESDSQGRFFTNTTQSFYITSTGTIIITKAGALVVRTINNVVL